MTDLPKVFVPATSANLGPGYDAFGAAFAFGLTARLTRAADKRVEMTGEGAGEVATDDDNLVWRSFVTGCNQLSIDVPAVGIEVANEVPLERGLGSSSAAIVAGLALARALAAEGGHRISDLRMVELATEIEGHPDNVAPAILGGITASAITADGNLVVRRAQPAPRLQPLVCIPQSRQNTVAARGVLPQSLPTAEAAQQAARAGHVIAGFAGVWPIDIRLAGDLLHEPPRLEVMTASGELLEDLRAHGVHAWLSGAGPTVAVTTGRAPGEQAAVVAVADRHAFAARATRFDLGGATLVA